MRLIEEADGSQLWVVSPIDARLEASQLKLSTQQYFGDVTGGLITLSPGDVVVDVGANIGSFARLAASLVGPSGHVYAVEPLPEVFAALQKNIAMDMRHGADKQYAPVTAIQACITSDGTATAESVTYFPRCTAFSTLARHRDDEDALQSSLSLVLHDDKPATSWLQAGARAVARYLPWAYGLIHKVACRFLLLSGARTVVCPAMTLNQLFDDYNINRVDLLKINVERSELEVLQSLDAQHWQRVKQVSMQLHDRGTALQQAMKILKETAGFTNVKVHKEPRFKGSCLVQVFASNRS